MTQTILDFAVESTDEKLTPRAGVTEPGIAIEPIRITISILFMKQFKRYYFIAKLFMYFTPVRNGILGRPGF